MSKLDKNLVKSVRARGVRKSTAEDLVRGVLGSAKPRKARRAVADLDSVIDEFKDRLRGGPQRRSRAAKKGVATRRRKAHRRSEAAKRAARTKARS